MRNPWIIAQLAVAAVVLAISLVGIIGTVVFNAPELAFSIQGGIQAFGVFPGLVISLIVNVLIMRAHRDRGVSTAQKVLLGIEFALIAALIVFHFSADDAGNTFGFAIITWPALIVVAIVIAIVSIVRFASRAPVVAAQPVPAPTTPEAS